MLAAIRREEARPKPPRPWGVTIDFDGRRDTQSRKERTARRVSLSIVFVASRKVPARSDDPDIL